MHIKIHLGVMTSIWAISNEHGHWTVSIGDEITFMDNLATSSRLVRRAGVLNGAPTLADSHPDAPVKTCRYGACEALATIRQPLPYTRWT